MKKCGLFALLFGLAAMSIGLFSSCDIGLGAAVDTEPPTMTIENPPASAIIRDAFLLCGTFDDDGSISGVSVVLTATEGDQKSYPKVEGTWDKDAKTWSAVIDPIALNIPDGKYEAAITMEDNGGHHSVSTRSFVIDNTAPVVILSRPASDSLETDSNKIESYGQYLTLEGQAADDNNIEKIVIRFYSKDNPDTLLIEKTITSIPPTISLDVAKFDPADEVYTTIYGTDKSLGEQFYTCTITAYDGSKRYPAAGNEKADDNDGNGEASYILWSDWEKFQNEYKIATQSDSKIKVPELYSIKAGKTATTAERSVAADTLITGLFGKTIERASFKLNPLNNPSYSISGLDLGVVSEVENERSLTVQLAKGLDGLSLNTDTMKVYLIPLDENGNEVSNTKLYPQKSEFQLKGDGQFLTAIQKDNVKDAAGNATNLVYGTKYVIGVEGTDSEGNVIVPSFDGSKFVIRFKAKSVAPRLTVDSPSEPTTYIKKGEALLFKGTTAVPDGYPTISITCKKGEEDAATVYTYKVTEADKKGIEDGYIYYNWAFTVPAAGTEGQFCFDQTKSIIYEFDIAADLENMPNNRSKTVFYDVENPTIKIDSMLPTAEKYTGAEDGTKLDGAYLNGDVTMQVAISDDDAVNKEIKDSNDDKRPYFIIQDANTGDDISFRVGTETEPTKKHYITIPQKQSFVIHTEDIASTVQARKIKVKIFAQDRAGNLAVDFDDKTKTYFEREYTVDQSTDIPVILPYNSGSLTLTYSTKEELENHLAAKEYKSVLTTGSDLLLSLKDDDGIQKVLFYIGSKDTALAENATPVINQTPQGSPSATTLQYTLPTISGRYQCKIQVEDTVGKKAEKAFWIIVTGAAPQVTISNTSPDNKIITLSSGTKTTDAKTQFENTISIESGYSEFTVKRVEKINDVETETVLYGENGTKGTILSGNSFTDTFTPSANRSENKIKYVVTDEMGHFGEREFVYYTDSAAPAIAADSIKVPSNSQTESVSFRFEATANDPSEGEVNAGYKQSGISKLQYVFENGTASTVPSATVTDKIKTVNGVSSLNETIIFDDEEFNYVFNTEETKTIYIRAIDDVGNVGAWVAKSFMFDKAKPVVDIVSYTRTGETEKSITSTPKAFDSGKLFTLSGTAEDSQGIKTFQIWQKKEGQEGYGIKLAEIEDKANGEWSIENLPRAENGAVQQETAIQSGKYIYTVVAIDKSANGTQAAKSTEQTVKVTIDRTAPVLVSTLADGVAFGEDSLSGNAYTFRGSLTDEGDSATGSDILYYAFTTTDVQPNIPFTHSVAVTGDKWNIPMNLHTTEPDCNDTHEDTSDTLYEGKKYLWIYGTDKAGNDTDVTKISFMVDQNKPRVSYEIYKNEETTNPITADNGTIKLNRTHFPELNTNTGFVPKYTLRGTAWDANGIEKVKVYTQRGTASAVLEAEVVPGSDGKWNVSITGEGNNVHTIYAYDKSGNATKVAKVGSPENSFTIIFDTTPPADVDIADYDDGPAITETTTIKRKWLAGEGDNYINGTAKDNESGLAEIRVIVDNPEETDLTKWTKLTLSDEWTYKFTIPSNFTENDDSANSYHSVTVKVVDKAGNETKKTRYFRYDKTLPFAKLTLNKNDQYVNANDLANITFSGYAHDGNTIGRAVGSAVIKVKRENNIEQTALEMNVGPDSTDAGYNITPGEHFGEFTKSGLNAADFADGKYTFTLDVKDKAGNTPSATSTLKQTMIVDKTKPSITSTGLVVGNAEPVTSISTNNSKATIQVTFTETNVDSVYYYVDDLSVAGRIAVAENGTVTESESIKDEWTSMSRDTTYTGTGWKYTKAHQFSDGKGKVYLKIVDKAGNVTYDTTSLTYEVDTKAPDVCTLGTVSVEGTALTGTRLINGTKPVVFTVTATDYNDNYDRTTENDPTKVASVVVKDGGGVKSTGGDINVEGPSSNGLWTITIPANRLNSGAVAVTVTDLKGNSKDFNSLFTLDLDNKAPSLGNYSLANSYDATDANATSKTFYMNNKNNGFRLEGIAKDDRVNDGDNNGEIEKVELTLTESGTNGKTQTLTSSASAWTFEITNTEEDANNNWSTWTGDVTGTIVITDKAKNVTTVNNAFTIKFDNDAPKAVHWADSSNKDIYFRFGNADNDKDENDASKWETGDVVNATNDPKNTDVGKKYSSNSWGNDSTIEIRGTFFETGSGIKTINYAIFNVAPTTSMLEALEKGLLKSKTDSTYGSYINAIGTFAPLDIPEERKVPYTAATGRTSTVVKSNFRTSLAGFNGTNNYLVLVAEDYVGNRAVDSLKNTTVTVENGNITSVTEVDATWNDSNSYYIIKKDTTAPTITASVTEGAYTNGNGNIKIVCVASDDESDINNVVVKVIGNDNKTKKINGKDETKANPTSISGKYEVSISASVFESDTYTVYAKATDNAGAGNSKEVSAGTITVDTEKPTFDTDSIKLTETTGTGDSAQTKTAYKSDTGTYYVNNTTTGKTFKISGRAEDNLGVKNVSISVVEKVPAGSTAKTLTIDPQETNGSFTFDVSAWSTWTTGATVTLNVTDKAGNTVASPYTMNIVFDTAAPTVVPANIVTPNTTQTESSLFTFRGNTGSISDGTSGPKTIDIAFTTTDSAPSAAQVTGIEVSSTGVWSSTVEFDDSRFGEVFKKTENDKVVDVEGTKYLWIRAYDNAGNVTSGDTEWKSTSFKYDKAVPSISFDDQTPAMNSYNKDAFTIKVNASDTWGVKDIKIYTFTGEGENKVETAVSNDKYTYSDGSFTFEKGALTDGTYNFKVVVTDNADKKNSVERSFTVDTTPPTISGQKVSTQPDIPSTNWYKTNQLGIEATITDEHSEISSVQAYVDNETNEKTSLIKGSNNKWTGSISCGVDGAHIIYIIAQDVALNKTEPTATIPVKIDTTAPDSPVFLGAGPSGSIISANDISSLLVNPTLNKPVIVYAALKEGGSGLIKSGIADTGAFIQRGKSATNSAELSNTVAIKAFTHIWTANNEYSEGNIVKNTDKLYVCDIAHTAGSTFDTEKWTELDESEYKFWSYTIPSDTSNMTNGGINFTVADKVGNKADYVLFQMTVDSTPPTVEIKSITKAGSQTNIGTVANPVLVDDVNGTITISGTASDGNKLESVKVYRLKDGNTSWVEIPQTEASTPNSWIAELDTTTLTDTKKYSIKAIAKDAAGNEKETASQDIYVNQDSDRPVITLTSPSDIRVLSTGSVNWESRTISGTVSDDDNGTISIGWYVGDDIVYDTDEDETSHYEDITINNGIWKFELPDDGSQNVFFMVTAGGKVYYANVSDTYSNSLIYDSTNKRGTYKLTDGTNKFGYRAGTSPDYTINANKLALVVDTIAPDVETPEYTIDDGSHWQTGVGAQTFGGTKNNKIKIRQSAWDKNDINKMTVKVIKTVNGVDVTTPVFEGEYAKATSEQLEANANGKRYRRFTTAEINTTGWASTTAATETTSSVSYRVEIVMSDGIKETTSKLDLTVDNTAPNISFSGPASGTHSGEITVFGTTDEVGGTTISYTVSTYGDQAHKPSSAAGKTLTSWTGYIVSSDGTTTTPKTNGTITPPEGQTSVSVPDYTVVKNSNVSWYVYFDNDTNDTVRSHTTQLKNYTVSLGLTTRDALNTNHTFTDLVNFYIWIKAEDAVGNSAEYPQLVCIDPQGDRPTVSLLSPEHPGDSLGGTVKLYGSAEDSNGTVDSVWVQLLSGKNGTGYGAVTKNSSMEITDFKPKDKDVEFWLAHFNGTNDNGVYYIEPGTDNNPIKLKLSTQDTEGATQFNSTTHKPENCYIKANFSGTSWNLKINKDEEFDPAATDEIANDMAVRVYARDNDENMSYAVTRYFVMDKDNPLITNVKLKQYAADDTAFANPTASQDARVGMYVKGKWYLEFTTTDNSALDRIFLVDKDGVETDLYTGISAEGNVASKNVRYALPTDTAGVGVFKRTIKASDVSSNGVVHTGSYDIEVYYDNEAPKLLIDTASDFNINPQVKQKDGFYELKSKVSDSSLTGTPSGVKAVGFYFLRRESDGKGKIYDPMQEREDPISTDDLDYADGLYWLSGAITCNESGSITLGDGLEDKIDYVHTGSYIRLDGVMYKITSVSETTITIEESHGSYTTAQIALAQFVDNRKSEYEAAKTKNSTGYYTSIKNDDGDSMIEELGGTSVVSSWQGSIVSRNIPDGPIEIHYTAFDESLNYAVGVVGNKDLAKYKTYTTPEVDELWNKDAGGVRTTLKTPSLDDQYASYVYTYREENGKAIPAYVCNNAPRLAGVTIAVDYTGSENPDINNAKKTTYYYNEGYMLLGNDGKSSKKPVEVTDNLVVAANVVDGNGNAIEGKKRGYTTIKGKTWIIPEMVGGNGKLWYEYKIYSSNDDGIKQTTATDLKKSSNGVSFLREGFADYDTYTAYDTANQKYINAHSAAVLNNDGKMTEAGTIVHSVSDLESLNDTTLASPYWFDYTIYDSTETLDITEATVTAAKLENNQKATISIAMAVEVQDETPPNTKINDLYWNSSTDNSVYTNPSTDKLEGHVELKGHLGTGFTDANYGTDDDKISGKVVFRGYAYDNKLLKSLNWGIKNKLTGTEAAPILEAWPQTYITAVQYNPVTGKWGVPTTEAEVTTWTATGDSGDSGIGSPYYYFKVYDDAAHGAYLNENGHRVYWELTIDTSYVQQPGQASPNAAWAVGKDLYVYVEATDSKNQTTDMNPAAAVIKTTGEDSELLRPNYKVDVVPYITGIKSRLDDNRSANGCYQIGDDETEVELIGYNLKQGSANLAISVPSTTGEYSIETVTGYPTINNMNNNAAVGTTPTADAGKVKNKYNYQPTTYNESLTDDVYIQLWQFNNRAAQTNTGVGFIREPAMAFNPVNGQIGVAFSNGANKFSMAQGRDNNPYSYRLWEMNYAKYVCNALAFDESGYSHGVSVGIDTEPSSGKAGRMNYFYSRWGRSDSGSQSGNFNNTNNLHIDTIGIPNANDYTSASATNNDWGATVIVEERFNSVSMKAVNHTVSGTTSPTVYIAYYDDVLERIVFRYGTVGTTVQAYDDLTTTTEGSHSFPITKYSLIAGGKNVAGTAALTPYNAGEYVALDVVRGNSIANDVVCVVWYDAIRDCLMYNYKTNPCNDYNADTTHTTTSGYWAEAKVLKEKCGQYCKIAVDANGGIHIAAYDSGNKGVGYVYLPSYNASYSEANNYYLIDAMNGPFDELGLAVAVDGTGATGKAYPTISYYANGTPKMATYSAGITKPAATNPAMPAASWANGKYTGNWDVCYVPSASQLLKDHVNVVQPQNTTGIINRVSNGGGFATTGEKDHGTVTGNTTTNPILGYAIREGSKGYLEIAQRK